MGILPFYKKYKMVWSPESLFLLLFFAS